MKTLEEIAKKYDITVEDVIEIAEREGYEVKDDRIIQTEGEITLGELSKIIDQWVSNKKLKTQ